MRKTVAFLPTLRTPVDLDALMARVGWYLYPYRFRIDTISVPLAFELPLRISVPEGYDPLINQRLAELLPRCEPVHVDATQALAAEGQLAAAADVVLVWHWPESDAARQQLKDALGGMRKGGKWYDVDAQKSRAEGSYYLWLGPQCFTDQGAAVEKSRVVLARFAKTVTRKKAYVFGTGPSLASVADNDYSDGDCYVANSIVKNRDLLRRIRPRALVAADPIFHTGCSAYAAEFRKQLIEVLDEFDLYFFVPVRDYYIYESVLPVRHHDRLACIPYDDKAPYNINLTEHFYVNGTSNVLTLFLLPLAASFHDEICVLGCDGRPRAENQYFWSHDPASQFGELMQAAMQAHPAFFSIDYNDYYDEHLEVLRAAIEVIEKADKSLVSLTPSHIPALAQRQVTAVHTHQYEVVGIAPDATAEAGHYIGYEDHLLSAFSRAGISYMTLCNKSVTSALVAERPTFVPALTVHTWDIGNNWSEPPAARVQTFADEIVAGVDKLASMHGKGDRTLYLYYGSLYHVEALAGVLAYRPWLSATVNLFWTCNDLVWTDEFGVRWRGINKLLQSNPRLNVTVSTAELQRELSMRLGLKLPLAPHPSPTFADEDYLALRVKPPRQQHDRFRVVFPGMLRRDKGYHMTVEAVRELVKDAGIDCYVRALAADDTPPELVNMAGTLGNRAHIIQGELTRIGFVDFLRQGDVAVIPYTVKAFARRTSGLLVDALYCGMPVVAIRGSWLGNRVEETGAGIVVADEDPAGIADAVQAIRGDMATYRRLAILAGARWYQSNSWAALSASILSGYKANG
jgi:glycosyltransferase involved in cell wall biosynthesis